MDLIARWVVSTLSIYGVAWLLEPHIRIEDFPSAIWAGLALGLINAVVRPIVIFLTLPATLVSLGLFLLVINAAMLMLAAQFVPGFDIQGFGWAFLGSLLISLASALLGALIRG